MENNQLKEQLISTLNIEPITAQCLIDIGLNNLEDCVEFLNPEKTQLTDVNKYEGYLEVKNRIIQAIENNEKVVIFGDYDCDGICATAMLYTYLTSKGVDTSYYIPKRRENGYGMNIESLEEICEEHLPDLLITVDCGITSIEEVNYIHEALGFDVVITDHHKPLENLPDCPIFNPHLTNGVFDDLCGAGVVLRLIEGLDGIQESDKYYDLAALATIADLVPLVKDNRKIVKKGLELINDRKRLGLHLLILSANLEYVTSQDVAFKLAPRINAVGRLSDAQDVVSLFYEQDRFLLSSLIEEINELNKKRQDLTLKIYQKVEEKLEGYDFEKYPIICLFDKNWDEGVIGIVAAKIVTDYNRPVILFTSANGMYKGSGRSIGSVDLFKCINSSADILEKFGGHKQACGLSLKEENFEEFKNRINDYYLNNNDWFIQEEASKYYDFHQIKNLSKQTKEIEMLEPFGEKNPSPTFFTDLEQINFKRMKPGSEHLIYKTGNFQMTAFFMAHKLELLNSNVLKRLFFNLAFKYYGNKITISANLKEIECLKSSNELPINYLESSLYNDTSIFKPKAISFIDAVNFSLNSPYYTAYVCYCEETFEKAKSEINNVELNLFWSKTKSPKNAIYFEPNILEDLSKFKKLVFLDRPVCFGYIDELKLNKDCEVYYVDNFNALNNLKNSLVDYEMLGKIYMQIKKIVMMGNIIDLQQIFIDIEKTLNVNYNNFVVALYIFMDLGLIEKTQSGYKVNVNVKNPIQNSTLYNKILGAK